MPAMMYNLTRSPGLILGIVLLLTFGAGRLLSAHPTDHVKSAAAHAGRL